jgi:hypothetical protein
MIREDILRAALAAEAECHRPDPSLHPATIARARLSRALHVLGSTALAISLMSGAVLVGTHTSQEEALLQSPAAGSAASSDADTVVSGTAPDGEQWRLFSFQNDDGFDCFGVTGDEPGQDRRDATLLELDEDDGFSRSCHAVPDDTAIWVHVRSAPLSDDGRNPVGALFAELSTETQRVVVTLQTGETVIPELVRPDDRPYIYFVALLDPEAAGEIEGFDADGESLFSEAFVLRRGGIHSPPG